MKHHELVIDNLPHMIEVNDDYNIPTALVYKPTDIKIGYEALEEAAQGTLINEDFKIDLGRYTPTERRKRRFPTADGKERTAAELADDFFYEILKIAKRWLEKRNIKECKHLVVAEPLSIHTEEIEPDWLKNYRDVLRRILEGKTILSPNGVKVHFLPEPFAVFQYYKYGIKHPDVSRREKMNVVVIDFGGGTCDMCVIETTKEGDLSSGGKNQRPLAGKSLPIGGFEINRALAEVLVRKVLKNSSESRLGTAMREYKKWLHGENDLEVLDSRYKQFIINFHALVHRVEKAKIELSRSITDWSLDANVQHSTSVDVPADPFSSSLSKLPIALTVADFLQVFVNAIYKPYLKGFIKERLEAGLSLINNSQYSVVLFSGGSANIGWFIELIRRDFQELLEGARIVRISDYQGIVAKGLAIDCAREFFTGTSDFKAVTYNPLYLMLASDDSNYELRPFQSKTDKLPDVSNDRGLLLPSACKSDGFIGQPVQWKVRLSRPPRRHLKYVFLQPVMELSISNQKNVEETRVYTPPDCEFDSFLTVELTIREDGTAAPKFIYRTARGDKEAVGKSGRPFCIDITDASPGGGEAYIGVDFGSSNSALSYIDRSWIQLVERRAKDSRWREIGELVDQLPWPLSEPLARYIAEFDGIEGTRCGFSFIEAALAFLAYVAYADYCAIPRRRDTRLIKDFPHRSASYSWKLLKSVSEQGGTSAALHGSLSKLLIERNRRIIEDVTRNWAESRHEVAMADGRGLLEATRLLANVAAWAFGRYVFGYFQSCRKEKFSRRYSGRLRVAHGRAPFTDCVNYVGAEAFSETEAVLADLEGGRILALRPLLFWYPCKAHPDAENGHCFLLDKAELAQKRAARYKAAGYTCSLEVTADNEEMRVILEEVQRMRERDLEISWLENVELKRPLVDAEREGV